MVIKYKASNLIEDFNLNAKTTLTELTELFGTEIKKGTVLTETQCNIAFEHYTKQAKTEDFANYLSKKAEKPAVKEEAKKADPKTEKPAAKNQCRKNQKQTDLHQRLKTNLLKNSSQRLTKNLCQNRNSQNSSLKTTSLSNVLTAQL